MSRSWATLTLTLVFLLVGAVAWAQLAQPSVGRQVRIQSIGLTTHDSIVATSFPPRTLDTITGDARIISVYDNGVLVAQYILPPFGSATPLRGRRRGWFRGRR